jgi:NAD(P)-dependent dehydrogenase (short-subunit alcohol dehydrogenase family)
MMDFSGQRVVITGAGGGLGRTLCAAFAAAGASIVACDLPGADLDQPGVAERQYFDVAYRDATQQAAAAILTNGSPDIVVSNAGATLADTLGKLTPNRLVAEMDANFSGVALLTHALIPAMRNRPGAALVFISSVNALTHHGNPAYAAAKAATLAWMRAIAVEEGAHGIRANAVIPASIRTHAWDARLQTDPDILTRISRLYPLGRIVTTTEVANAVLFLASPLASGITGATLTVDAGLMAGNLPFLDAIR